MKKVRIFLFLVVLSFTLNAQVTPPSSMKVYTKNGINWELTRFSEFRYYPNGNLKSITELDSASSTWLSAQFFEYDSVGHLIYDSTQYNGFLLPSYFELNKYRYALNGKVNFAEFVQSDSSNGYHYFKEYKYTPGLRAFSSSKKIISSKSFDTTTIYITPPFYDTIYYKTTTSGIFQKDKVDAWFDSSEIVPAVFTRFINSNGYLTPIQRDSIIRDSVTQFASYDASTSYQNGMPVGTSSRILTYFPSIPRSLIHTPHPEKSVVIPNGIYFARGAETFASPNSTSDSDFAFQFGSKNELLNYIRRNNNQGILTDQKVVFGYGILNAIQSNNFDWSLYPNPTHDYVQIEAPLGSNICIYFYDGVLKSNFKNQGAMISTNGWNPGMYLVRIQVNGSQKMLKLMVR